jgi:hypothetical protein
VALPLSHRDGELSTHNAAQAVQYRRDAILAGTAERCQSTGSDQPLESCC